MGVTVTRASVPEYLETQRQRYRTLPRGARTQLLNEIVAVIGYHRKVVLRRLRELPRRRTGQQRVGRSARYGPEVARAAQVLWEAAGQIGAKRLQPFVPDLLARLTACGADWVELQPVWGKGPTTAMPRAAYAQFARVHRLLHLHANFFQPVQRLLAKSRDGARVRRWHDRAQTPYQRLVAAAALTSERAP